MAIETRCAGCGKIVRIDERYAGARARCTFCQTEFIVPQECDEAALDSVCHYCGVGIPRGEQEEAKFKACDECRESIDENVRELAEEERQKQMLGRRVYMLLGAVVVAIITIYLSMESMFW